jgi:uncharacterized protein YhjY with autotransporter beta-barrel domain
MVFDAVHYLPLIEQKINALDQAAPLAEWDLPPEFATLRRLMEARMIKAGRREYVQVLRLLETFDIDDLHAAVKKALQLGAIGFDAVIPTGLFRDDNDNPNDESALIAWFSPAEDAWIYGSIALDDPDTAENEVDLRLAELATAAGVDIADLQYTPGDTVPADVVAILEGGGVFAAEGIEDLSNLNLNFSFDVGDIEAGEFTLRIAPRFAELVAETVTASQFSTTATLDLANVPFLGTLEERQPYLDLIDQLVVAGNEGEEGLAAQNRALDSMGFNFLETYTGLSFGIVQEQIYALSTPADLGRPGEATISTQGGNWRTLGNNLDAFFAISGSTGDVDPNGANLGYDFDTYSVTAGLAMHLTETLTAGIMVGYGDGDADIDNGFGKIEVDGASVAGFVKNRFANGASLRGFLGYQDLSFDSERNIFIPGNPVQTARGDTDGSVFFAGVTGDLPLYKTKTFDFGLMAAVEYYDTEIDGFTETGAGILNLTVGKQETDMTVARLGMRARGAYGNLRPYGHLAWATRNGDDLDVGTSLGGLLPGSTQVAGADDDWLDVGLGLVVDAGKSGQLRAEYRGAYSDDYTRNTARLSYEIRFWSMMSPRWRRHLRDHAGPGHANGSRPRAVITGQSEPGIARPLACIAGREAPQATTRPDNTAQGARLSRAP